MHLDKLEGLAKESFTHPNTRFHSWEACVEPAKKSFARLSPDQKAVVTRSWLKYLKDEQRIGTADLPPDSPVFKQELENLQVYRFIAQTNLFYLCHLLEKYSLTTISTHEEICNKHFIQKDPTFATFDDFANQYTGLKESLLLVPRGGFKSSIDIADSVQWVICYPDVTIAIITGVLSLAASFLGEFKEHFSLADSGDVDPTTKKPVYIPRKLLDRETQQLSTSAFQVLFPEHCTKPGEGTTGAWDTPAIQGIGEREPTIKAASLDQALAGWHHKILKLDDCVNDENSRTTTRIEGVNKQISIMEALLNPNGFKDVLGTWYDENDYYGLKIKHEELTAKDEGISTVIGSVDSGRFNSSTYTKIYLRACWWPTEEAEQLGKIEEEMRAGDYILWFPERLTYKFLSSKKKLDQYFAIKYLNNPRKHHQVKFPRELLIRRTIPHNQLPQQGTIVATVDTAYSVQNWADYTVMITALISGGRFYIVNMIRGRFNEYELPAVIAAGVNKWKPKRLCIEDSVGVKWMGRELRREMDKLRITVPVEFVSLGKGTKANSKKLKAKPVARLLGDERMFFLNSCEGLVDIYSELEKFTGTNDDSHDDIVSALSLLAEQFGAYADMEAKVNFTESQYVQDKKSAARHDLIYGLGKYRRYNASQGFIDDNPRTQFELDKSLGGGGGQDVHIDPLDGIF